MKARIFYDSKLARLLLPGCHTIMLFGAVFTKKKERKSVYDAGINFFSDVVKNHELIHVAQYRECFVSGCVLAVLFVFLRGFSLWYVLLPVLLYYVLYLVEWAVSFVHHLFSKRKKDFVGANDKAYDASAMEMEAYDNERDLDYLSRRKWYAFMKYYGKL